MTSGGTTGDRSSRTGSTGRKQVHLAAQFSNMTNSAIWRDPEAGSQIDFASFRAMATRAEAAKLDFFFLAEQTALRYEGSRLLEEDVAGRPDTFTVLAALAAVTDHLGLAGTVNATFNEAYDVARQLLSLHTISEGRAAWNVVTSAVWPAAENFRRGDYLKYEDRYTRAAEMLEVCRELWDSWNKSQSGAVNHHGRHFDVSGRFPLHAETVGHPLIIQAGDSEEGREFAARHAEVIFTFHNRLEEGRTFYADVKQRMSRYGRHPDDLKVLPAAFFVVGDSEADATERAEHLRAQTVTGALALRTAGVMWNRDLRDLDPNGPLPADEPDWEDEVGRKARQGKFLDPQVSYQRWRAWSDSEGLSIRDCVLRSTPLTNWRGTPEQVADMIVEGVQTDACDGYVLSPRVNPGGLDDLYATVVPILQERGVFRTEYEEGGFRANLGTRPPGAGGA